MYPLKTIPLLLLISCFFVGQSCVPPKVPISQNAPTGALLITPDFSSGSLNQRIQASTQFTEADLTRKDLKKYFDQKATKVDTRTAAILVGNFRKYPSAWFYTQIINTTNETKTLVADEFNRLRCDAFELYTIKDHEVKKWGSLNRSTPFAQYPLPFLTYALPFTIQAKDTLHLVIHTQRHFGVHEVNLNVSTYEGYLNTTFAIFFTKIFQCVLFVFLFALMVILGQVFNAKSLTYWGFYIASLLHMNITTWGFTDTISHFTHIGLSGSNISVFAILITSITPHFFLLEWMKAVPKNEKRFRAISYLLVGISTLSTVCFLLPKQWFDVLQNHVNLTILMIFIIFINLTWLFYCSVLAWVRIRKYYLTLGLLLAYMPFLLSQTRLLSNQYFIILKTDYAIITCVTIGLALVGIYLLREQLVTRKKLDENLLQLKETLEDIRKNEVEAIGRNLHDNVGNILASAAGYLNLKRPNTATSEYLIKEAIQEIRFLSHNLVKDDDLPLLPKLENLVSRFNDFSTIRFELMNFSKNRVHQLDKITQQNIYMIVQEILTNTVKHSKATETFIQIFETEDSTLQFTIEDDGIGIGNFNDSKGIGLKNINKRANVSNLKLTVDSSPTGANFIIETPKIS
jgi:signal transduction histidine kinase